jgi:ABC-type sugar transport system substrate-binding protein
VPTPVKKNLIPTATFSQTDGNPRRVRVNLLGLIDPTTNETVKLVANETVFVAYGDSRAKKGLKVTQSAGNNLPVDLVFVVDNSGSMGQEADRIAAKITDFATALTGSGIDARFGVVGINGDVTGGVDLTTVDALKSYLDKHEGTERTVGFGGANADALAAKAKSFDIP